MAITVKLPDGSSLELEMAPPAPTPLRRSAPAWRRTRSRLRVDGEVRDLALPLADGRRIEIVTPTGEAPSCAVLIRHDAAHVMATAVLELWPGTKVSIGPPIADGFYYDFEFPDGVRPPRTTSSGSRRRCARTSPPTRSFERSELPVAEAIERFRARTSPTRSS